MIEPPVFSVTSFNQLASDTLKNQIGSVLIRGEVSQPKLIRNQWLSFNLVDEESSLNCFGVAAKLPMPNEGDEVKILAEPRIYVPRGQFSAQILAIELKGQGALKQAYDRLYRKLDKEGLFSEDHKQTLPAFPTKITLITSKDGAAITDVLKVLSERWPCQINLMPVKVQGIGAEPEIISAISRANQSQPSDLIILTRGGGSAEDLQTFNLETVAREVFSSKIPIVVAIGHQQDTSIAELAADKRAATPTHAAQVATPLLIDVKKLIRETQVQLTDNLHQKLASNRHTISSILASINQISKRENQRLGSLTKLVDSLNPEAVLRRGYSITRHQGRIVKSNRDLSGQEIIIQFAEGKVKARVNE